MEHLTWPHGGMVSVSTLLRQWERGGCADVGLARCWVLRDRNRVRLLRRAGLGTVSSGPLSGSPVGELVGVPPVL